MLNQRQHALLLREVQRHVERVLAVGRPEGHVSVAAQQQLHQFGVAALARQVQRADLWTRVATCFRVVCGDKTPPENFEDSSLRWSRPSIVYAKQRVDYLKYAAIYSAYLLITIGPGGGTGRSLEKFKKNIARFYLF